MSEVFMSDGTLLQVSATDGSPLANYVTIPGVISITPPSRVRKSTDVYVHDQSAPITKTGAYEAQEVAFTLAYDPGDAAHLALQTSQSSKTTKYYRVLLPTSPAYSFFFTAQVASFEFSELNAEGTEALQANVTLKLAADFTTTAPT
jgi:hypothetical protein